MNTKTVVTMSKEDLIELVRAKFHLPESAKADAVAKTEVVCVDQWRNETAHVFAGLEVTFELS